MKRTKFPNKKQGLPIKKEIPFLKLYIPFHKHWKNYTKAHFMSLLWDASQYFNDTEGWFFQKDNYVAARLQLDKRSIGRIRKELVAEGVILYERRGKGIPQYKIDITTIKKLMEIPALQDENNPIPQEKMKRTKFPTRKNKGCSYPVARKTKLRRTKFGNKKPNHSGALYTLEGNTGDNMSTQHNGRKSVDVDMLSTPRGQVVRSHYIEIKELDKILFSCENCRLAPTEDIVEIIQNFNSLEGTSKHQLNRPTKTLDKIALQLTNLLEGRHIEHKKDGNPPGPLYRFYNAHKIPESLQTKKWSVAEITAILPKAVEMARQSNLEKVNLPTLLYNFKHGYSQFLKAASMTGDENERLVALAETMKQALPDDRTPVWELCRLLEPYTNKKGYDGVLHLFNWAVSNQGGAYIPTMYRIEDFVNKYQKFESALKRADKNVNVKIGNNEESRYKTEIIVNNEDSESILKRYMR